MVCIFGNEFLMIADHVGLVEERFFFLLLQISFSFQRVVWKSWKYQREVAHFCFTLLWHAFLGFNVT